MSRIARENPDLTLDEINDLAMRTSVNTGEVRTHLYECRSCGDEMWLDDKEHAIREHNKATGQGFTIPKCWRCWI